MTLTEQLEAELTQAHYDNWGTDAEVEIAGRLAEAKQATESTDQRCFRLGFEAVAKDKHAEDLRAEAEQDRLLAVARRAKCGEHDEPAKYIERRAVIGEELAAKAEAEAERLRSQARALRRTERAA